MGTFTQRIRLANPARPERTVEVEALVDTAALFSWIPVSILGDLGMTPQFSRPFLLADGRTVERGCTEAVVWINGDRRTTIVTFGDEGGHPLLGAFTLEAFTLAPDPANKRLIPIPVLPALPAGEPPRRD